MGRIDTNSVGIFGIEDGRFATEHEVVALGSQQNGDLATKENEGETIAKLGSGR